MSINALIIDGEQANRKMLVDMLARIGVTAVACSLGAEALAVNSQLRFDFIIVSRHLDDISAELFLVRFREQHHIDDALTIMLSNDAVAEVYYEANKAGYKLVFNKKDFPAIKDFILSAVNSRTIDLQAKILYLENEPHLSHLTSNLLARYRADVTSVLDLKSAIAAFTEEDFDLIVTDYYLDDGATGDDLISFVRGYTDSDKALTPILVVSSETNQSKRTSFLRNGADDYIIKPYDNDELIARASNLVSHKRIYEKFRQQQQELLKMAMSDQLTGLYNRRSLFDFGSKYISDAVRHRYPLSLLVIDVDLFKLVNDNYGHAKGDAVLKKIAEVLQGACRKEDFVARFGGEEFVMLLSHCSLCDAILKAETVRKSVAESLPEGILVTVSTGVAELAADDDLESLFVKADTAVYKAKDRGRNRVEQYEAEETEGVVLLS